MDKGRDAIDAVRRFNRFYTGRIGLLQDGRLYSPYSLAEARVLYELAQGEGQTAATLGRELGLDAGYLSRILAAFRRRGLVAAKPSTEDRRRSLLRLTAKGRSAFLPLDARSRRHVGGLIGRLGEPDRQRLVAAMGAIERLLDDPHRAEVPAVILRGHRPGDLGWVVHRHGALYAQEHGWDVRFEGLVAGIVAKFIAGFDGERERCWIAERQGEILGSVTLVKQSARIAKLRMLYVEPHARGMGIGKRLVAECERFARKAAYRKITLWTESHLAAARGIYEAAGYRLVRAEPHEGFGGKFIGERWELDLA
jgi:DNA-binding MarR family transcriptional regulator/L-amino acid N-acyltransferase YncA